VVSFFKDKSPTAVIGLIVISIATRALFWNKPPTVVTTPNDGLIYLLLSKFSVLPGAAIAFLYHFIVLIQALRLNYALNDIRMLPKPAFTTALAYVLLTALMPSWNNITAALVANSMIIWLVYRLIRLYNTPNPKTVVYNIGLITGSTVLLYYPSLPLIGVVFFALATLRPFRANEWIILLIGTITPLYFLIGWLYLNDEAEIALQQLQIFHLQIIRPLNLLVTIATFTLAGIAIIAGIITWQANSGRLSIQARKSWSFLFVMLLLLVPVIYFMKNAYPDALLLAAVPGAAFVSNTFLYPKRNFIPALLFWLFIGLIVYINWYLIKI
jgi:hypothetical protein